jgi:periplasmic divalent cation tolerance protein
MNPIIIQTTCSSKDEAKNIAKYLIENKLVACVQMYEIDSFYNWNNKFCCDNETLLNIKTIKENFEKGITTQLIRLNKKVIIGAKKKIVLSEVEGKRGSLINNFNPSDNGCNKPYKPITFGPCRN